MPWYETPCIRVLQSSLWPWLSRLAPIGISSQPFLSPLALFGDCLTKKPFLLKISPATRSIAPKSAGASSLGFFDPGAETSMVHDLECRSCTMNQFVRKWSGTQVVPFAFLLSSVYAGEAPPFGTKVER